MSFLTAAMILWVVGVVMFAVAMLLPVPGVPGMVMMVIGTLLAIILLPAAAP